MDPSSVPATDEDFGPTEYDDMPSGKRRTKQRVDVYGDRDKRGRRVLQLDPGHEMDVALACAAELAEHAPTIFQRAGMLVRIARDPIPDGSSVRTPTVPRIEALPKPVLRARIDELVTLCEDERAVHPPGWLVDLLDTLGDWKGVRRLEGLVQTPVLRADGTILDRPGYDHQTGLLFEPNDVYPDVRPCPTKADAEAALKEILDVIEEFPFEQEKHRAAYVALLLTPFARYAFHGPAPLGVIDGTVAGVGKGLLAQIIATLVDGCDIPPTPQPQYDDEERKLITSIAMAGRRLVLIDNVTHPVGSGALEALLTTTRWSDRILGVMKMWEGDVAACWLVTGNNVQFRKKDTIRRVVHVRLKSLVETPESRGNWRHPDLRGYVKQERGRLVRAVLTILRAHALAGSVGLVPWGSFEGWSATVRSAVVWLGLPDPAETRNELAEGADTEGSALKQLLERWNRRQDPERGMQCSGALEWAKSDRELSEAIALLCPTKSGAPPTARALGYRLRDLKGRVVGIDLGTELDPRVFPMCLESYLDRKGVAYWRAVQV